MIDLTKRSYKKELLDGEGIPFEEIKKNMDELNVINSLLGGHNITIKGIKNFIGRNTLTVCEIGCGGGDNLKAIENWSRKKDILINFIGVDINASCITIAKEKFTNKTNASFFVSDYKKMIFTTKPDVIFSSLFCHHFKDEEIAEMLIWMKENSLKGFFINDLERNTMAYWSIKMLTMLFSGSFLVKNDAPLSVLRGFKKNEWKTLLDKAGIKNNFIKWCWAFRYLIVYKHA